jgi:Icc protein
VKNSLSRRFRFLCLAVALSATTAAVASASERETAISPPAKTLLSFAVISDIHVQKWNRHSHEKLAQALNDLKRAEPDAQALVVGGDLGDGLQGDYETLGKLMRALPHPKRVFYNIGNHEYYKAWHDKQGHWSGAFPNGESERASQRRFLAFAGRKALYEDAWVSGYHFIFLGSEQYRQSDPANKEDAWLSDAQLGWLERALADGEQPGKPVFVFLHQPLPCTVAGSRTRSDGRGVVQHERLRAILAKHPQVILFTGHTHWELKSAHTLVRDGFTMVNTSSVYEPFNEADAAYGQEYGKSEGVAVEVYPNRVLIRGRSFTEKAWIPEAQFEVKLADDENRGVQSKSLSRPLMTVRGFFSAIRLIARTRTPLAPDCSALAPASPCAHARRSS